MHFLPHIVLLVTIALIATSLSAVWPRNARDRAQWGRRWWAAPTAAAVACASTIVVGHLHPMVSSVYGGPWISGLLTAIVCFIDGRHRLTGADLDEVRTSPAGPDLLFRHHIVRSRHMTVFAFTGYVAGCLMNSQSGILNPDFALLFLSMFYCGLPIIAFLVLPGTLIALRRVDSRLAMRYLTGAYMPILGPIAVVIGIFGGAVALSALVIWLFY